MAVYTPLEREEVSAYLSRLELGPLEAMEPIAQGIENTNYRLSAGGRAYVLTVFEGDRPERVEAILQLTRQLALRGIPCPRPVEGPEGLVGRLRGKPVALVPFLPGEAVREPTEGHLESLGRATAGLHGKGQGLPFDPPGPHRVEVLGPLARRLAARLADRAPDLAELMSSEADYQEAAPEVGLPAGVIHADLFLDNVLFDKESGEITAILDFYLAGRGPFVYDLAVVLLDAGWGERGIGGDRARAFLRGYRSIRPLAGLEYEELGRYLRRAALRFLCLRVERTYLSGRTMAAGRAKDPREYERRLRLLRAAGAGG